MIIFICQLGYAIVLSYSIKQFGEKKQKKDCRVWGDCVCSEFYRKKRRQNENQMCVCRTNIYYKT